MIKVSVNILTYNHEKFIAQAIEGALMQKTNFDYEILIGEDDSTDDTRKICKQYAKKYPNKIRLFLNDRKNVIYINRHPTGRWNFINLLKHSRGKYIALCEGDDYWTDKNKLQKQVDFLDNNHDFVICHHAMDVLHKNYKKKHCPINKNKKEISTIKDLCKNNFIYTPSCCFRNKIVKKLPEWFKHVMPGDWPLYILLTQNGKIKYINKAMGVYRIHSGGIWSAKTPEYKLKNIIKMLNIINKHLNFKYDNIIKKTIVRYNLSLSKIFWINNKKKESLEFFLKSFTIAPLFFLKTNILTIPLNSLKNISKWILRRIGLFEKVKKNYLKITTINKK